MATKKNTTETTVAKEVGVTESNPLAQENELLKKQMEAMQAQMELLAKQMAVSNIAITSAKKPERNMEFINMVPGALILEGTQIWKIEGQFNSRPFLESEARIIVNNMRNTVRSGLVYIADSDFVKECELESAYTTLLSEEQLKELLVKNFNEVVEIYKTVPKAQQDIIVSMIKERKESGIYIDANILIQIGKLCGQDLIHGAEYEDEG